MGPSRGRAWATACAGIALGAFAVLGWGCDGILGLDATTLEEGGSEPDGAGDGDAKGPSEAAVRPDAPADASGDATGEGSVPEGASEASPPEASTEAGTLAFVVSPSPLTVHPSGTLTVTVSAAAASIPPGGASITFTGLPSGVSSSTATFGADAGSVQIQLTAVSTATPGTYTIDLQANGATVASLSLTVYGKSGTVDVNFQGGYIFDSTASGMFNAVTVDATGRVVAGGDVNGTGWLLRRFASDGTSDTTFDAKTAQVLPKTGSIAGLAFDPATNNIIAVGTVSNGNTQLAIAVVDQTGSAAASFNNGNYFELGPASANNSAASAVVVSSAGSFMVAGTLTASALLFGPVSESAAPSWGSLPTYTSSNSKGTGFAALAMDSKGRFVAAGTISTGPPAFYVQRFTGTTLDTSFTAASPPYDNGRGLALGPLSGDIVAVGGTYTTDQGGWAGWAPTNGALVWSQNVGSGGGGAFYWNGAAPMPGDAQDRVYVVGSAKDTVSASSYIDRITASSGAIDSTFGGATGIQTSDPSACPTFWYTLKAVTVQSDGLVLVAGQKVSGSGTFATVGRYWP
jgi:hypothetical protein